MRYKEVFPVWYNDKSMMNILLIKNLTKHFRVTMDTKIENAIYVHINSKRTLNLWKLNLDYIFKSQTAKSR